MTNYERIKNMSVEELVGFIEDVYCLGWNDGVSFTEGHDRDNCLDKQWLESEVEG